MANPLTHFVSECKRLMNLARMASDQVPDAQLTDFITSEKHLDFLRNLIGRAKILSYCYDSIDKLTDRWRDWRNRIDALPTDPGQPNTRTIPQKLVDEQEQWLVNEQLILSGKKNENFTEEELNNLTAVGVRECNLDLALHQLGALLELYVLPKITIESDKAIRQFNYIRYGDLSSFPRKVIGLL